jgi:hypothetical protein
MNKNLVSKTQQPTPGNAIDKKAGPISPQQEPSILLATHKLHTHPPSLPPFSLLTKTRTLLHAGDRSAAISLRQLHSICACIALTSGSWRKALPCQRTVLVDPIGRYSVRLAGEGEVFYPVEGELSSAEGSSTAAVRAGDDGPAAAADVLQGRVGRPGDGLAAGRGAVGAYVDGGQGRLRVLSGGSEAGGESREGDEGEGTHFGMRLLLLVVRGGFIEMVFDNG